MVEKILQALRRLHREESGFTLIELLIVIAIIAVIAAIAIPTVANRISDAREAADRANVKLLQGLVDMYYIDEGEFPAEDGFVDYLLEEGYLNQTVKSHTRTQWHGLRAKIVRRSGPAGGHGYIHHGGFKVEGCGRRG